LRENDDMISAGAPRSHFGREHVSPRPLPDVPSAGAEVMPFGEREIVAVLFCNIEIGVLGNEHDAAGALIVAGEDLVAIIAIPENEDVALFDRARRLPADREADGA